MFIVYLEGKGKHTCREAKEEGDLVGAAGAAEADFFFASSLLKCLSLWGWARPKPRDSNPV